MSTSETPNLHLVKPDYDELADIEVINENMDTIDAAVKAVQDSVSTCQPAGKYAIYTDMGTGSTAASITAPSETRITIVYSETAKTLYADVHINGAWKGRKALATWTS